MQACGCWRDERKLVHKGDKCHEQHTYHQAQAWTTETRTIGATSAEADETQK